MMQLWSIFLFLSVILSERQAASAGSDDIFTDISQMPAQDENCPEEDEVHQGRSPYFSSGGRKSTGYKRKRTGDRKLVKKGKWLGKKTTKDKRSSSSSSTPARKTSAASTSRSSSAGTSAGPSGGLNLLAPPRPRTVAQRKAAAQKDSF